MNPEIVLSVRDLRVHFETSDGVIRAVDGVSFDVRRGETVCIVGESGSGKSVSVMSMLGLLPTGVDARITGTARLSGSDLLTMSEMELREVRGRAVGVVSQDPMNSLNPLMTIGNQIREAILVHNKQGKASVDEQVVQLLQTVEIPDAARRAEMYPHEFSGGMKQRAMIAMAIANEPKLLIADEPTTALDVSTQAQVLEVIRRAKREAGASAILITHDLGVVAELADRVVVMYAGKVVEVGEPSAVFDRPKHPYTRGLLDSLPSMGGGRAKLTPIPGDPALSLEASTACSFQPRCSMSNGRDECVEQAPPLVTTKPDGSLSACHFHDEVPVGGEGGNVSPLDESESGQAEGVQEAVPRDLNGVLNAEELVVEFSPPRSLLRVHSPPVQALSGVSLSVSQGQTLGIVGESGCGKSTLGRCLVQLLRPTAGSITFRGQDFASMTKGDRRRFRRDVQFVFQDPFGSLDPKLSVYRILAQPLKSFGASSRECSNRIPRLLEEVGLPSSFTNRYPNELSGGQRQRLGIARALSLEPEVLVLDEPVSALDTSVQAQILNLLADLQLERELAYVFISHDLSVVRHVADQVAVMYLGKVVEQGSAEQIFNRPRHPYTNALLASVPVNHPSKRGKVNRRILEGDVPNPSDPPSGCRFRTRCWKAEQVCADVEPVLERSEDWQTLAACHFPEVSLSGHIV